MKYILTLMLAFVLLSCEDNNVTETKTDIVPLEKGALITNITIDDIQKPLKEGDYAPNFILNAGTDQELSLLDLRGKVVYIYFWFSTCTICAQHTPHLVDTDIALNNDDFVILTVTIDQSTSAARNYISEKNMKFFNIFDGFTKETSISYLYNVRGFPQSFLIDKKGKIRSGVRPGSSGFIHQVENLLAE